MDYFAGLDVSVKETSVCIVDDAGKIVREARGGNLKLGAARDCCAAGFRPSLCQLGVKSGRCGGVRCTSALPPKAEVHSRCGYVAKRARNRLQGRVFVPHISDVGGSGRT